MATPTRLKTLTYVANCTGIKQSEWDSYMKGAKRANKKIINRLVKKHLPELHNDLALNFYNPYNYYITDTHIILVHSHIEYFLYYQS